MSRAQLGQKLWQLSAEIPMRSFDVKSRRSINRALLKSAQASSQILGRRYSSGLMKDESR